MQNDTVHIEFVTRAKEILKRDENVIGLTVGGSWLSDEIDEFSDLDLTVVTQNQISNDGQLMLQYAKRLGNFLSGFTGDHVGEPRLLICLYKNPLLHVDLKFLTLVEFNSRVENPVILLDKDFQLRKILQHSDPLFPLPDYQWIEDRFWIWIHYILLKIGRGEYLEAFDNFAFLRKKVLGPLLHIKNGNLPREVRRVETKLNSVDLKLLKQSIPEYDRQSLLVALRNCTLLYKELRSLFTEQVHLNEDTELQVMKYFSYIESRT